MRFNKACQDKNLQVAHKVWCHATERFLLGLLGNASDADSNAPKRGTTLPTRKLKVANTVANPWTMVIHFHDAFATGRTVVCSWGFHFITAFAVFELIEFVHVVVVFPAVQVFFG